MFLRQSTGSQSVALGPFVDDTDFKTLETGLTISNTDIKIVMNGGASANKNSGGGTHRVNGMYGITFDATDTAAVGIMDVSVLVAGAFVATTRFYVLEEVVYDALFAASAPGFGFSSGSSLASGSVTSATSETTLLDTGALAVSGYYVGARLRIVSGTGANQERVITDFTSGRVASHSEWTTAPDNTSGYVIEPARTSLSTPDGSSLVFSGSAGATEIAICNMALSHLGISKEIANLETELSQEAAACRRFFEQARDNTLRNYPWPFARKISTLALVETDPNDEWGYSYRAPSDFIRLCRILSGQRNDTAQSRVPYKVGRDTSGILIFTDKEDAEVEYVIRETDPTRYPSDFSMALSLRLASYIAPRLTAGDPYKLGDRALQLHLMEVGRAEESSINEEQEEQLPDSEFVRERE